MGPSWGRLGPPVGRSWVVLGPLGRHLRVQDAAKTPQDAHKSLQDASKRLQDAPKRPQGASGTPPGPPKSLIFFRFLYIFLHAPNLAQLAVVGSSWPVLGQSWGRLGGLWGRLGGPLGPSWGPVGPSWGPLGALLARPGALLGPKKTRATTPGNLGSGPLRNSTGLRTEAQGIGQRV